MWSFCNLFRVGVFQVGTWNNFVFYFSGNCFRVFIITELKNTNTGDFVYLRQNSPLLFANHVPAWPHDPALGKIFIAQTH